MNDEKPKDWENLALDLAAKVNGYLLMLRPTADWQGIVRLPNGLKVRWEDDLIATFEEMGLKIDRRWIDAKLLPAKERRKAYAELQSEKLAGVVKDDSHE